MKATNFQKKIVIADDHVCVREGLIKMVEEDDSLLICAAVNNGVQLLKAVAKHQPDLVVTDIRMSELGGLEAGLQIKKQFSATALLAYSADESNYLLLKLLEARFDGIVFKTSSKKETVLAIHSVLNGRAYYCHAVQEKINDLSRKNLYNPRHGTIQNELKPQELQVLLLLCKEQTSRQIAQIMNLSERTIEGYRETLLRKTNSINVAGLVCYAYANGFLNGQ